MSASRNAAIASQLNGHAPDADRQWKCAVAQLGLSTQHCRLVELVLLGHTDKEIAHAMGISENTVRTYLARIFARLGVRNRMTLARHVFTLCLSATQSPVSSK